MKGLNPDVLKKCRADFLADDKAKVLMSAAARTDIHDLSFVPAQAAKLSGPFSLELPTMTVTSQEKSGRCWAFAGMNLIREIAAKNLKLSSFVLSGNYLSFFDKLEKCSTFLDHVEEYHDLPMEDRAMTMVAGGIGDGGYWCMFTDLVEKYGVVPAEVMPETYTSEHTANFNDRLNRLVRKDGAELRERLLRGEDVTERKAEMLSEIYRALCIVFGNPPESFDYTWRDSDSEYHCERGLTPKTFYDRYIGSDLSAYVAVENRPTTLTPEGAFYRYPYHCCMTGSAVEFLNVSADELKELTIKQLRAGEPVWFICDVDQGFDRKMGILDPASFCYGEILGGADLTLSKGQCLEWRDCTGNHAMVFTGVNLDGQGKPDRWKIENTWGKECGRDGYFVCSDAYFNDYVYEVIVRKEFLSEAQKALMAAEPRELKFWQLDVK